MVSCFISATSLNPPENPVTAAILTGRKQRGEVACPQRPSRQRAEPGFEWRILPPHAGGMESHMLGILLKSRKHPEAGRTLRKEGADWGGSGGDRPMSRDLRYEGGMAKREVARQGGQPKPRPRVRKEHPAPPHPPPSWCRPLTPSCSCPHGPLFALPSPFFFPLHPAVSGQELKTDPTCTFPTMCLSGHPARPHREGET